MIARLLHYANADPPYATRQDFYRLKTELLERYAKQDGFDVQHIPGKVCWSCNGTGGVYERGDCYRCMGDGWYRRPRWIMLERFRFGRYIFHVPREIRFQQPMLVDIEGYIRHPHYGALSAEAVLWLYLLCRKWRLFWQQLRSCESFRPRIYKHPLSWIGTILAVQRCQHCGRYLWRRRECKVCKQVRIEVAKALDCDPEIPF